MGRYGGERIGLLRLLWEVKVIPLAVMIVVIGMMSSGMAWAHWNERYVSANVIDKHIDVSTSCDKGDCTTSSHYVVVTDKGAFEVDTPLIDRIFNMESRNADITYAKIQPGKSYVFHTYGYRIDVLWVYPIVTDVHEER